MSSSPIASVAACEGGVKEMLGVAGPIASVAACVGGVKEMLGVAGPIACVGGVKEMLCSARFLLVSQSESQ